MLALGKLSSLKSLSSFAIQTLSAPPQQSQAFPVARTSYNARINKAGREGDFATVHHVLNKRVLDGFFNTNNTFKFISTNNLSIILNDLLETISRLDNYFARKCSYDCLTDHLSNMHCISEATRVAEAVVSEGHVAANNATFHPIINALMKEEFDESWRVMDVMKSYGVNPDLTTYNYVLTGYCFIGNVTSSADVLARIEKEELGEDTRTYDALVLGECRAGKLDAALVRRMLDDGVSLLYCTHAHIIGPFLKYNYYEQPVEFVRSYAGRYVKLDAENYGILATRLITRSRFEEAKELVKEMSERRLTVGPRLKDFCELHVRSDGLR